jgi:hypothetical protein
VTSERRKRDESEHVRSLHGHPSGDRQVFGVFGGVVTGGGLGMTILLFLYWERRSER